MKTFFAMGNTPTGVGKTCQIRTNRIADQKHPHGRGEDPDYGGGTMKRKETPPRAWGRPRPCRLLPAPSRNTPTGVGKTTHEAGRAGGNQKHPHGRGEDSTVSLRFWRDRETPPRAWGRQPIAEEYLREQGNTPTGVGKTQGDRSRTRLHRKHPHGRGEDNMIMNSQPLH